MDKLDIDWSRFSVVEVIRGPFSGAPLLRNTRLPVSAIVDNYDDGLTPKEIAAVFEVPVPNVRTILGFREQHFGRST
jgi:uncharacterized protein (DUF433 family)